MTTPSDSGNPLERADVLAQMIYLVDEGYPDELVIQEVSGSHPQMANLRTLLAEAHKELETSPATAKIEKDKFNHSRKRRNRDRGKRRALQGLAVLAVGITLTAISYSSSRGPFFTVWVGVIVLGLAWILSGVFDLVTGD